MTTPAPISVESVSKRYETPSGPVPAVEGVSLTVRPREFVSLLGPSGCGKSTVLGMIGGLVRPDSGRILIDGETVSGPNPKKVALVFQDAGLFPWRTALDNVGFGLELMGVDTARRREIALGLLEPMGLKGFEAKYPRELSGGMRMRVSIARALVTRPRVLLMDEPFASLDEITRFRLESDLAELHQRRRLTVVFVTHSVFESVYMGSRVVVLSPRPGRVAASRRIEGPTPRVEVFRTSTAYLEACRDVSALLSAAMEGSPVGARARV